MQKERVRNPPLTSSVSVGVNSRAPWRIKTLFWSFIVHLLLLFWAACAVQSLQKTLAAAPSIDAGKSSHASAMGATLADLGISVPVRTSCCGDGANGFSMDSSADALDFLGT